MNPLQKQNDETSKHHKLDEQKLAMKLFGPTISVDSARQSALRIAQHQPLPSVLEFLCEPHCDLPRATLCHSAPQRRLVAIPTELFSQLALSVHEVPDEWMWAYAHHMQRLQRTHEFQTACLHLDCGASQSLQVTDSVVAGLLLYLHGGDVEASTRHQWLETAITTAPGSWLAAEGLHTKDERERILSGVLEDSSFLWWTSQVAGFGRLAVKPAGMRLDINGGLVLATSGNIAELEEWLRTTALAACERPEAACAALVFQPQAESRDRACWLAALQNPDCALHACETVRWARYTWPVEQWKKLRDKLRPVSCSTGQGFYHWHRDVSPETASIALGHESVDLVWAVELLSALPDADDYAFRFQLGEKLDASGASPAAIALRFLNHRLARKSNAATL